ncbi:c-type cytochrome [Aliifodinibius salicampi]|uniref:C-type cytochrome n=1 Tax=Fodinibius salicampi TaxID=1920655 RepID=A0ABT3Q095_9BACT|nr:c-type cytochrome [Fodinibius salicampi]MCW9713543.1 c-type cytochrome [Fodinibius salicampi]
MRRILFLIFAVIFLQNCQQDASLSCTPKQTADTSLVALSDSLSKQMEWPNDLDIMAFSGPEITPSPAALAVKTTGEVFVGVDMQGSLGKDPGKGSIQRLVDCNQDGIMDTHTEFTKVNNPRGIIAMGDRVFVLHTIFSEETGKASGMDLVVFEDKNQDGIADGPAQPLIEDISNPNYLRSRGTDHATNGIRMGIDGWIYIAVGDFGFHEATDRDGTKLTMLGGGVLRVRPDGTEMEVYTHGLRNIYDVAIDPYMNIFTRGNTNDGGGWNVRFAHHVQSGEYGYPMLFKHFTEETIPALVDVGGGSGTGALYMDDDRWPAKYNHVPMMADWGRSYLYMHHVSADQGSFTQEAEKFIELPQITDLDVDGSGIMYLSAWDGAGYSGDSTKGFTVRAVPEGLNPKPFPNLQEASIRELVEHLKSGSAKVRLNAQYELLQRPEDEASGAVWQIAKDKGLSTDVRVAGIFTYAQIAGKEGIDNLVQLTGNDEVKEFALRALADRKPLVDEVPIEPFLSALESSSDRVKIAAIVGLGRLGREEAVDELLNIEIPSSFEAPETGTEGPHATPNSDIIPPHVAVKALVEIGDTEGLLNAVEQEQNELALWALRYVHEPVVPQTLIEIYNNSEDPGFKNQLLHNLARIYHKEAPYDGSWWWSTRPDTHGPYYKAVDWQSTPLIRDFLVKEWRIRSENEKQLFAEINSKYRLGIDQFGGTEADAPKEEAPRVDLEEIKNKEGQVGEASIEDVMLALEKLDGDIEQGKKLFIQQGCQACHTISQEGVQKGPFLGQIGGIMNRQQIAESILKPNASISQGFATVQISTDDNKSYTGFVTRETAEELEIRDIAGQSTTIKKSNIESRRELETSMMPSGLANALSYEEFTSLVEFLSQQVE